jgi:hypothetical protein
VTEYDLEYVKETAYVMVYGSVCETVYERACEMAIECVKAYAILCG